MIKTIVTSTLLVAGLAQAQIYNTCQQAKPVPAPVINDVAWTRMAKFRAKYVDFYSRCGSMIGQLSRAEHQADMYVRSGNLAAAANVMITNLVSYASQLPPEDFDVSYPMTMESIRQGAQVAQKLQAATTGRSVPAKMGSHIRFAMIKKIYRAVKKAYYELDANYYNSLNERCYGNCVGVGMAEEFNAYYDGVADLAKEFLNIQSSSAVALGTDDVELKMTAAAAKAAKKVILNSPFRRDYSCAILELHDIQVEAESFTCGGNPGFNQAIFVESLRERLASVNFPKRGCGYGYGHHHGGFGGGAVNVNVDVDVNVEVND